MTAKNPMIRLRFAVCDLVVGPHDLIVRNPVCSMEWILYNLSANTLLRMFLDVATNVVVTSTSTSPILRVGRHWTSSSTSHTAGRQKISIIFQLVKLFTARAHETCALDGLRTTMLFLATTATETPRRFLSLRIYNFWNVTRSSKFVLFSIRRILIE